MDAMKILMVNHGTAGEWGGGDSVQIKETAKRLAKRGHTVNVVNSDRPDTRGADIVHIFNCRVEHSFPQQIKACVDQGAKIVVSPIWINLGKALWGSRGAHAVVRMARDEPDKADHYFGLLRSRRLVVDIEGHQVDYNGFGTFKNGWHNQIPGLLKQANGLLPNSWQELKAVQSDLFWSSNSYRVANYGVDPRVFLDADPGIFRAHFGIQEDFVLQAGRIEPGKNQAMLCWALKETGIRVVLIGSGKHWPSYSQLCKDILGERLTIIDHMSSEMLASAYAASRVHSLVSWMDTCGLVSLEAALAGTAIVGSTFGHELEYLRGDAWLADPGDFGSIKSAVLGAWETGDNSEKSNRLRKRILSEYNWDATADETECLYRHVLSETA